MSALYCFIPAMSSTLKIQKARKSDAKSLTELTFRSKDYWNYGARQIKDWQDELTILPSYVDQNQVYKLTNTDELVGFYAFYPENSSTVKLDFFFIEPTYIGRGYGKYLMTDFLGRIKSTNYNKIILEADPNAEKFYGQFGFKVIGKQESSIKDRYLPVMALMII